MATVDRFEPSKAPIKRVKAVQFSVWSPDDIVSGTACTCFRLITAAAVVVTFYR